MCIGVKVWQGKAFAVFWNSSDLFESLSSTLDT